MKKCLCLCLSLVHSFPLANAFSNARVLNVPRVAFKMKPCVLSSHAADLSSMELPTRLRDMVTGLRSLPDDKMRVRQVLFMAAKGADMDDSLKVASNKVPGCLSTVYVDARLNQEGCLSLQGWSDSQLTMGLITLLTDGLSGCSPAEIQSLQPDFIQYCGLGASLTPG